MKAIFKYLFLLLYISGIILTIYESSVPGNESKTQSDAVADPFNSQANIEYDNERIIDVESFEVVLSGEKEEYVIGDEIAYSVSFVPENTSYKGYDIEYDSEYVNVDTLDSKIEFIKDTASTTIKFVSTRNESICKEFEFEVLPIEVESVKILNKPTNTFNVGDTYLIEYEVTPADATYKDVAFSSSSNIASIDGDGLLTCKKDGEATIYCRCNGLEDSFDIKINPKEEILKEIESLSLDSDSKVVYLGNTATFTLNVYPLEANYIESNVSFSNTYNLNISISNKKIRIKASKTGEFKDIELIYKDDEDDVFSLKFSLIVKEKNTLSSSNIDESRLNTSINAKIVECTYISADGSAFTNEVISSFSLSIPFSIKASEYNLQNYKYEYDDTKLQLVRASYNGATFKALDSSTLEGSIYYYVDKSDDDFIEFKYAYEIEEKTISKKIKAISLEKLGDGITLFKDCRYDGILNSTVTQLEDNTYLYDYSFDSYILEDGSSLLKENEYLKIDGETLVTKDVSSQQTIRIISKIDSSICQDISFAITDSPNSAYLIDANGEKIENDIDLNLNEIKYVDVKFGYNQKFSDGTSLWISSVYDDPLDEESSLSSLASSYSVNKLTDNDAIIYEPSNKIFKAINEGSEEFEFAFEDASLNINLAVNGIYNEVDLESFDIEIKEVSNPLYNEPLDDFSKVAIGTQFEMKCLFNENATNKKVHFISSDSSIVSVSSSGLCEAESVGKATIKCILDDNSEVYKEKEIDVCDTVSPFTIDPSNLNGEDFKLIGNEGNVSTYSSSLYLGYSSSFRISPVSLSTSKTISFEYLDDDGNVVDNPILSVDSSCNISLNDVGKIRLKVIYGDETTLSKFYCYIDIEVKRDNAKVIQDISYYVRKYFGHYGLFMVLALCSAGFIFFLTSDFFKRLKLSLISLLIGLSVAGLSELIQLFVDGRYGSLKDVGIDFGGYATGIAIFALLIMIIYLVKKRKRKNDGR